jgi:hypothetical protein
LITPPNAGSGGGSCSPLTVVVAPGEPSWPVTWTPSPEVDGGEWLVLHESTSPEIARTAKALVRRLREHFIAILHSHNRVNSVMGVGAAENRTTTSPFRVRHAEQRP